MPKDKKPITRRQDQALNAEQKQLLEKALAHFS
jgi:hypothetical protein